VTLQLYNTLTRKKAEFIPIDAGHARMYVCGPTVYAPAHIGNARPVVVFDTLFRLLRRIYPRVSYVRNITDIDDKIIAAATQSGEPIAAITERFTDRFHTDMDALNALRPTMEPRATGHLPQMIALVETLIARGHAYAADGHVLFHVPSMPDYGALSRRNRDEMVAGARVEVAPYKKDAADFVLWKPSTADQPGWESPWGRGRPGWHLECSAMSEAHLGVPFDIHGGGLDLIFPHHENEIAQSRCAHHGGPFVRVWMHNGFLSVSGEKMSKSLGNIVTVSELLGDWPGEAIRLALLSAHYRQPLDFSEATMAQAKATLDRWYGALRTAAVAPGSTEAPPPEAVRVALEDDLNTPQAIAALHEIAGALNRATDAAERRDLAGALRAGGAALGLLAGAPEAWFRAAPATLAAVDIDDRIAERLAARKRRDFARADAIRQELADAGVVLEDKPDGTTLWRVVR